MMNGTPALAAARARARSPLCHISPAAPVGATASGKGRGLPKTCAVVSIVSTPPQKNIPISRERLIALVPARHPWARRRTITLPMLVTAPIVIGTSSRWRGFRSLVNDMIGTRGLSLNIAEEADDLPVLLQLVQSGFGCTILDASFIPTLPPGIKALGIEGTSATLDIALAWRDGSLSPLAARFVEIAKVVCSARRRS